MFAALDVLFTSLKTLVSCLFRRQKLPKRSWRGEFIFRLAKAFLNRSIGKDFGWIRDRQKLLTLYSPDLFKVRSKNTLIAGVPCIELHAKHKAESETVIVYFHGGGYAVGSAQGYKLMGAKLALLCQAKVVLVDYRLVPDHALPAAQEDCYAVTQAISQSYQQHKLILMGDSAGGTLCLSTLKRLNEGRGAADKSVQQTVAATVLISPWVAPLSYQNLSLEHENTDMLDRHITQYWVDTFYPSDSSQADSSRPDNVRADIDFSEISCLGLAKEQWPKVYIQAAGAEVFLKQVQALSTQLNASGVDHDFDVFADQFHVFQTFSPVVPEARAALMRIAAFVRSV